MPLFTDYHITPGITLEESKKAHSKDFAVQQKYNLKYNQYWPNEEAVMTFCLMEVPDKETTNVTHPEANDVKTCNIIEADDGMYSAFISYNQALDMNMNNPSYFIRCFHAKYGVLLSQLAI